MYVTERERYLLKAVQLEAGAPAEFRGALRRRHGRTVVSGSQGRRARVEIGERYNRQQVVVRANSEHDVQSEE